jgi:hypothetical protein
MTEGVKNLWEVIDNKMECYGSKNLNKLYEKN